MSQETALKIIIPEGQAAYILTDRISILQATKADDMAAALFEILTNLRKRCLWIAEAEEDEKKGDGMVEGVDLVMDKIWEIANGYGIDIDELIQ